jgi:hypothetical protein
MSALLTPAALERGIAKTLRGCSPDDLPTLTAARSTYATCRAANGFVERPGKFTSSETDIAKLMVGAGMFTLAFSLPPATSSGRANTCAWSDHCEARCVGTTGSNRFSSAVSGKAARLDLLIDSPLSALALLVNDIDRAVKTHGRIGMRLNTYSDIRWERVLPSWFWERYAATVTFYDYTKHPQKSRPTASLPANYRLTYSVSPRSTEWEIYSQRAAGNSVAVVVTTRGGKTADGTYRDLPIAPDGTRVIDGDSDDRRYRDAPGALVLLRRKGGLKADDALVISDDRLRDIL